MELDYIASLNTPTLDDPALGELCGYTIPKNNSQISKSTARNILKMERRRQEQGYDTNLVVDIGNFEIVIGGTKYFKMFFTENEYSSLSLWDQPREIRFKKKAPLLNLLKKRDKIKAFSEVFNAWYKPDANSYGYDNLEAEFTSHIAKAGLLKAFKIAPHIPTHNSEYLLSDIFFSLDGDTHRNTRNVLILLCHNYLCQRALMSHYKLFQILVSLPLPNLYLLAYKLHFWADSGNKLGSYNVPSSLERYRKKLVKAIPFLHIAHPTFEEQLEIVLNNKKRKIQWYQIA